MADKHHVIKQQWLRQKFPRGAVEMDHVAATGPLKGRRMKWLVPVEKPPNPAHKGLRHVSLNKLLKDPRNLIETPHDEHMRHHNAINPAHIEPSAEAWEFARWVGLEWRLEKEAA